MKTDSNEATPKDVQQYKSIEYYDAWQYCCQLAFQYFSIHILSSGYCVFYCYPETAD